MSDVGGMSDMSDMNDVGGMSDIGDMSDMSDMSDMTDIGDMSGISDIETARRACKWDGTQHACVRNGLLRRAGRDPTDSRGELLLRIAQLLRRHGGAVAAVDGVHLRRGHCHVSSAVRRHTSSTLPLSSTMTYEQYLAIRQDNDIRAVPCHLAVQ